MNPNPPLSIGRRVAYFFIAGFVSIIIGGMIAIPAVILSIMFVDPSLFVTGSQLYDGGLDSVVRAALLWWFVTSLALVVAYFFLRPIRKKFIAYLRRFILFGLVPTLLFGVGIVAGVYANVSDQQGDLATCTDPRAILQRAQAAVYSVNRDDGGGGSMVALTDGGLFITNYHVIEGANKLTTWNYDANNQLVELEVKVVDQNQTFDLALIKAPFRTPDYLQLSNDYHDGEDVYTIGFPGNAFDGGLNTVTKGIVSRTVTSEYNDIIPEGLTYIQTDAAINPGNSGGAMINGCGLIGVNTLISDIRETDGILREEGIGYAVPADSIGAAFKIPVR